MAISGNTYELELLMWRSIFSAPEFQVSDQGEIRRAFPGGSNAAKVGRLLKLRRDRKGYERVNLSSQGVVRTFKVHSLVAEAFLGRCPAGQQTNHKNGVKHDNRVANLEYVTPSGNVRHALKEGLRHPQRGSKCSWAKLTEAAVVKLRRRYATGQHTLAELAVEAGVSEGAIFYAIKKTTWEHVR
jgi:hypothetical protein